jgi:hypothetical protein
MYGISLGAYRLCDRSRTRRHLKEAPKKGMPVGRLGELRDVLAAVSFSRTPRAERITGQRERDADLARGQLGRDPPLLRASELDERPPNAVVHGDEHPASAWAHRGRFQVREVLRCRHRVSAKLDGRRQAVGTQRCGALQERFRDSGGGFDLGSGRLEVLEKQAAEGSEVRSKGGRHGGFDSYIYDYNQQ